MGGKGVDEMSEVEQCIGVSVDENMSEYEKCG